ncbi:unnamed protein product [Effrenium voratum]|nr:unnamed protein product [Effrenium voratum]
MAPWALLLVPAAGCSLDPTTERALRAVLVATGADFDAEDPLCSSDGVTCENLGATCKLTCLTLSSRELTGYLPEAVGDLRELRKVWLNSNQLTGPLPGSLGRLTQLDYLDLSSNGFTGQIPESFGQLAQVKQLFLHENLLNGSIPASLGKMRSLTRLDLSQNQLSGKIPLSLRALDQVGTAFFWDNPGLEPASTQKLYRDCGPVTKDPCKIFFFLDPWQCLRCCFAALGAALAAAWLVRRKRRAFPAAAAHVAPCPVGVLQLATEALRPTRRKEADGRWGQLVFLALAVVAHIFVPLCLAWSLRMELVLGLGVLKGLCRCGSGAHLVFLPKGLSSGRQAFQVWLGEIFEILLSFALVLSIVTAANVLHPYHWQRALEQDSEVVAAMVDDQPWVRDFFLCTVGAMSVYWLALLSSRREAVQASRGQLEDCRVLALALAQITAMEAWAEQEVLTVEVRASSASSLLETELVCDVSHTPSATSASVPASGGLGPSVAVRAEKVGTRRLLVRWEETSCQVQLRTPVYIFCSVAAIVVTSFTDLIVATQFLQGHFFWFAFLTLATSWCSMLAELQTWRRLRAELRQSARCGYLTDPLRAMQSSERGIEGFIDLGVKVYGMPWGVDSGLDFASFLIPILICLRGLVLLLRSRDQLAELQSS